MKKIRLLYVAFFCIFSFFVFAQTGSNHDGKSVTLVVCGTADTKDEAIKTALRSAIEQAFGTFVSSNTTIVNDELTKDEIVSVSSGNIENYSLISSDMQPDGKCSVSLKATVSIGKLIQFAQSKGASTEFAGQTFAMNIKLIELRQKNTLEAYKNMCLQLGEMAKEAFDYELKIGEPTVSKDNYVIPVTVIVHSNEATNQIWRTMKETLNSLQLNEVDHKDYTKKGYWAYTFIVDEEKNRWIPGALRYYLPIPSRKDEETIYSLDEDLNKKVIYSFLNYKLESLSNSEDWFEWKWNKSSGYNDDIITLEGYGPSFKNWKCTNNLEYHPFSSKGTNSGYLGWKDRIGILCNKWILSRNVKLSTSQIFDQRIDNNTNWDLWNKKDAILVEYTIKLIMPKEFMATFNGFTIKKNK